MGHDLFKYTGNGGWAGATRRGGNTFGVKGNKKGALKRQKFYIDFTQFESLAEQLDALGGNLEEIFSNMLGDIGEEIQVLTYDAMDPKNLPAKGAYSRGYTRKSIELNPKPKWSGPNCTVNFGFDKDKPGAGSFLITGTPRMQPNHELEVMYAQKGFTRGVTEAMRGILQEYLSELKGG